MVNVNEEMVLSEVLDLQKLLFDITTSYRSISIREGLSLSEVENLEKSYSIVTDIVESMKEC